MEADSLNIDKISNECDRNATDLQAKINTMLREVKLQVGSVSKRKRVSTKYQQGVNVVLQNND